MERWQCHSGWFVPFKTFDVVDSLPHAYCIVGDELFFNFCFYIVVWRRWWIPEIVTGLCLIINVPDLKADVHTDKAPRTSLLIQIFGWGRCRLFLSVLGPLHISWWTCYGIWIRLYVAIRRCPEHVPVHVIKTVCHIAPIVRPALNCPEGVCFSFQFLPINKQEQNWRVI